MSERLLDFTRALLEGCGSLAERREGQVLETVLTPETAGILGMGEMEILSFLPGEGPSGARAVGVGGDFLEKLGELLADRGRRAEFWTGPLYLKREGLTAMASERLSFQNAALRMGEPTEGAASYLRITARYSAVSEEKREGILELAVNERTGASLPDLLERWDDLPVSGDSPPPPPAERLPAAARSRQIRRCLEEAATAEIEPFQRSLERRLGRDARRTREYYDEIIREIERKIARRVLGGEEREKELARIRATEAERERKIESLVDRYALRVRLEPLVLERLVAPVILVPLVIRRREKQRSLPLLWNPILKGLEPLPCEGCGEESWSFSACNDSVHLLCGGCCSRWQGNGKERCPACRIEAESPRPGAPLPGSPRGR